MPAPNFINQFLPRRRAVESRGNQYGKNSLRIAPFFISPVPEAESPCWALAWYDHRLSVQYCVYPCQFVTAAGSPPAFSAFYKTPDFCSLYAAQDCGPLGNGDSHCLFSPNGSLILTHRHLLFIPHILYVGFRMFFRIKNLA